MFVAIISVYMANFAVILDLRHLDGRETLKQLVLAATKNLNIDADLITLLYAEYAL